MHKGDQVGISSWTRIHILPMLISRFGRVLDLIPLRCASPLHLVDSQRAYDNEFSQLQGEKPRAFLEWNFKAICAMSQMASCEDGSGRITCSIVLSLGEAASGEKTSSSRNKQSVKKSCTSQLVVTKSSISDRIDSPHSFLFPRSTLLSLPESFPARFLLGDV